MGGIVCRSISSHVSVYFRNGSRIPYRVSVEGFELWPKIGASTADVVVSEPLRGRRVHLRCTSCEGLCCRRYWTPTTFNIKNNYRRPYMVAASLLGPAVVLFNWLSLVLPVVVISRSSSQVIWRCAWTRSTYVMVAVCFFDNDHGVTLGRRGALLVESWRNWSVRFVWRRVIIISFRLCRDRRVSNMRRMISCLFVTLTCCWRAPRGVLVPSDVASCWPPPRALNLKLNFSKKKVHEYSIDS